MMTVVYDNSPDIQFVTDIDRYDIINVLCRDVTAHHTAQCDICAFICSYIIPQDLCFRYIKMRVWDVEVPLMETLLSVYIQYLK